MLKPGDVVQLDLGLPRGSAAGLMRPAIVITAQRVLARGPRVIQVIPLTRTLRGFATEVTVVADPDNGLDVDSAAQCQHIRAVATERVAETMGNVGGVVLSQIRETIAVLFDF
jgi:mRNA interferase MazF